MELFEALGLNKKIKEYTLAACFGAVFIICFVGSFIYTEIDNFGFYHYCFCIFSSLLFGFVFIYLPFSFNYKIKKQFNSMDKEIYDELLKDFQDGNYNKLDLLNIITFSNYFIYYYNGVKVFAYRDVVYFKYLHRERLFRDGNHVIYDNKGKETWIKLSLDKLHVDLYKYQYDMFLAKIRSVNPDAILGECKQGEELIKKLNRKKVK